ncbi:hypothetical protein [Schauerella aestuarii]|uniref:hypothetical protein n=1 Tax=Schauerella aestuarii TaxID=2511204 RepID=UPI00136CFA9F|nr:hypothetical protein [Achromobacter aestuarii]MYZ44201.1 hypothetical protein [Achromobacter aestuarii]
MTIKTENFIIGNVTPSMATSNEISREPKAPRVMGIESAFVHCLVCKEYWTATAHKKGAINTVAEGLALIECPECHTFEDVNIELLVPGA